MKNVTAPATASAPATLADKPVFIPAARRKALAHADVPAIVARYIIGADDALIRPSDIRQSVAVLKTGMGAAAGLESFINGLAGIAARLAWGAITADQAADGLPDFSAWAVKEADKAIISRKGVSAGLLRALVADVVQKTAALPIRTAPAKGAKVKTITAPAVGVIETPAPAPAPAAVMDRAAALAELARMTREVANAPINTRDAIPHQITDAESADALAALAESAARIKAEAEASAAAEAERKADAEEKALAELTAANQSAHLRAVAFCRLADAIGIKLTKAQLAALDAFEGKRTKVPA